MATALPPLLRLAVPRRSVTVPAAAGVAALLGGSVGLWAPAVTIADVVADRRRMPRLRLMSFALAWSTLESVGIGASTALWMAGRRDDRDTHYALQHWWAARLVDALRYTVGVRFEITGLDRLSPGPTIVCARHASIADSLLPAWLLGRVGMRPRFVLKDDLQLDPCLDIVGNRTPNHFVDRDPDDSTSELEALERLARGMGTRDAAVIFPEGMVVTDERRRRAIERVTKRDAARARRVRDLTILAPVRPGGTAALLRGSPDADLVLITHTGFEPLQRLAGAPAHVPLTAPIHVDITRIPRAEIPAGADFTPWFDTVWAELDHRLAQPAINAHEQCKPGELP